MRKRIMIGVLLASAMAVCAVTCQPLMRKVKGVDTTKDVYSDDETPKVQVYVENGVVKEIPWQDVPTGLRWMFAKNDDGTYKYRVPIVRIEITSTDKQGNRVPRDQGYEVNGVHYGLNPKHVMHVYYGHAH